MKETFQDKGGEYGQDGLFDNEVVPLLAEFGDYRVVFLSGIQPRASAGLSCATRHGGAWYTCEASRTYRRQRRLGRCSKATEPPHRRCPTLKSARYTSYRSRRC